MPAPIEHVLADVHLRGDLGRNVPTVFPFDDGTQIHSHAAVVTVQSENRRAFVLTGQQGYTYDDLLMLAASALTAAALIGRPTL